jgi:hypothetical protein
MSKNRYNELILKIKEKTNKATSLLSLSELLIILESLNIKIGTIEK